MIKNLQDELNQLGEKITKGAKLRGNMRFELEGKKCFRIHLQSTWKTESTTSNNIWILYWW